MSPFLLSSRRSEVSAAAIIVLAGFWIYWPALYGPWLWDDTFLIAGNPLMRDPSGLWKIWLEPQVLMDYFPGTVTIEWFEWHFWGDHTTGYHLDRLVLHLISALLVWRLLAKLGLRLSWLGGLIFAIHPVAIESVAWIAELKNTLSLPPFLIATCAWIDWDRDHRRGSYLKSLGFFLVAALCKATVLMFPLVILLFAWWRRYQITLGDLRATAPFFLVSLAVGVATVAFNHPLTGGETLGPLSRLDLAGLCLAFYFAKMIWPVGLMPIYPKWTIDPSSPGQWLPWVGLILLFSLCWLRRATWGRAVIVGLGFFVLNLLPFVGLTQGAYMEFTWVMEHMLYLPMIGLIGLFVAGLEALDSRLLPRARPVTIVFVACALLLFAWGSRNYASLYGDPTALWAYTVAQNPDSAIVRTNYGESLAIDGQIADATAQFEAATNLDPSYLNARHDLGKAYLQGGRVQDAVREYQDALQASPLDDGAAYALGDIYVRQGDIPAAQAQYEKALQINAKSYAAHYGLGSVLVGANRLPEAIDQFQQSLAIDPAHSEIHTALGQAYLASGQRDLASEQFAQSLELNPNDAVTRTYLGVCLAQQGHLPEAAAQFETALQIAPNYAPAHYNLGGVYLVAGRLSNAITEYQTAVRIEPNYTDAQNRLGQALTRQKNLPVPSP